MIALKTSPLLFGHEILLVFHLFLLFRINSMRYDLYRRFIQTWKKIHEFSGFFIMSSFVLCDILSGYLERPNNSDSDISHR